MDWQPIEGNEPQSVDAPAAEPTKAPKQPHDEVVNAQAEQPEIDFKDNWKGTTSTLTSDDESTRATASQLSGSKSVKNNGQNVETQHSYQKGKLQIETRDTSRYEKGVAVTGHMNRTSDGKTEIIDAQATATDASGKSTGRAHLERKPASEPQNVVAHAKASAEHELFKPIHGEVGGAQLAGVKGDMGGGIEGHAGINGPAAGFTASATASLEDETLVVDAHIHVNADALSASAGASKTIEFKDPEGHQYRMKLSAEALAKIGADGDLDLKFKVGKEGVELNAEGSLFLGAKGTINLGMGLEVQGADGKYEELASGEGKVTLSAGIGAAAYARAGLEGSEIAFKVGYNVTVGVGGGVTFEGKVDPLKVGGVVVDTVERAAKNGDLKKMGAAMISAGEWLGQEQLDLATTLANHLLPGDDS